MLSRNDAGQQLFVMLFPYINNKESVKHHENNDDDYFSLYFGKNSGAVVTAIAEAMKHIDAKVRLIFSRNDYFLIIPAQSACEKLTENAQLISEAFKQSNILIKENQKMNIHDVERQIEPKSTPLPY